jgi:dTDP-4-dehydrorhamnose reductase
MDLLDKVKEIIEFDHEISHITKGGISSWYEFASAVI